MSMDQFQTTKQESGHSLNANFFTHYQTVIILKPRGLLLLRQKSSQCVPKFAVTFYRVTLYASCIQRVSDVVGNMSVSRMESYKFSHEFP